MKSPKKFLDKYNMAHRITIIYLIFGMLWILLSDKLLSIMIRDIRIMTFIQTIKGNLYVVITAGLLWILIILGLRKINSLHEETYISEAKYRSYFEQGFIGIVLFDTSMQVVETNTKAQKIFGMTSEMLKSMDLDAILPDASEKFSESLQNRDSEGETLEVTITGQTGEKTHTLLTLSKITEDHGDLVYYVAFLQEINEQKKYREALLALNNQLESRVSERTRALEQSNKALKKALSDQEELSNQLEKSNQSLRTTVNHLDKMQDRLVKTERMTALGNLVASLTHEINTPVGSARTAGSYIKDQTDNIKKNFEDGTLTKTQFNEYVESLEESSDIIERNLTHAADLMTNFKQMAADQTQMEVRCINLKELIEETLLSLKPVLKRKQINYDIDVDPEIVVAIVPGYLTQILNNLLTNTYKHGFSDRDGGKISIQIKLTDGHIKMIYEDNGRGIAPEVKENLFKPFQSTVKRESRDGLSGIGLGLYIIRKIVEENFKGQIKMESEEGSYTRFIMAFDTHNCQE